MDKIHVIKRDGSKEELDFNKIHQVLYWATENISNVSVSEIELKTKMQLYDKITTKEIHETLIKAAADLISEETPNYQYVAARLVNFSLRKDVYGRYEPPVLLEHVKENIKKGVYDKEIVDYYTEEEWERLNKIVNHDRDFMLTYAAIEQFRRKYLVQDRVNKVYYETPQMAYILIAAILFKDYPKDKRFNYIKQYYDAISKAHKSLLSLPTPVLAGVRTPTKQFSSCVLIMTDDSLDSINETASAIVDYTSRRAGIGVNAGKIRGRGAKIRGGEVYHTGNIPFYKYFQAALHSCYQGGIRSASATVYYPIWHYEVEDLLVLKNNKGTEENRVRHMDYGVEFNGYLLKRMVKNEKITLFSPEDVPDLYEAFFNDQEKFAELYEKYERAYSIRKKQIQGSELFDLFVLERNNTGRIYMLNVDHANTHSSFKEDIAPIYQSNLCLEITLPTYPITRKGREVFNKSIHLEKYKDIDSKTFREENGEIALCTLSAINWGAIQSEEDMERACDLAIRALDELLDYQDYPMVAAGIPALKRRALGVGVSNLAYLITKHGYRYSDGSAKELVNRYGEMMSYYLIKASVELAKEKGACDWYKDTKYSDGIVPMDTYKKYVDNVVSNETIMDWNSLKDDLKKYGIRNSTVMALMPVESSSQIINATNGIEPPKMPISVKLSKDGALKQVVPEIHKLKNKYEYLWDMPHTRGYLELAAILQKWTDQTISTNTSYNPANYPDNKVPVSELYKDILYAYKLGLKTLYYQNTYDGSTDENIKNDDNLNNENETTSNEVIEEDCESCKL